MSQVSFTDFRSNLAACLDQVERDREALLVTRQGHPDAVVMVEEEFRGWQETVYLRRSPTNAARLLASIAEAAAAAPQDLREP